MKTRIADPSVSYDPEKQTPHWFPNEACDACRSTKYSLDFLRNRRQLRNNAQKIIFDFLFAWLAAHQKIICADMEDEGQFDQQINGAAALSILHAADMLLACQYQVNRQFLLRNATGSANIVKSLTIVIDLLF